MTLTPVSTGDPHVSAHNEERTALNDLADEVAGKITSPPNPKVGDIPRWTGSAWGLSEIRFFEGSGQPEGRVAAPIGARYRDVDGTNGAVEWVKVAGSDTSNTGWMLIAGDTGWRNVAGLFQARSNGVANSIMLRRVNNLVDFYMDVKTPTNTSSPWTTMTLPVGFRPDFTRYGLLQDNKEAAAGSTAIMSDGSVNLYTIVSAKTDRFNGIWTTEDAWPTNLPGTAG